MIIISAGLIRSGSVALYQLMREIVETTGIGDAPRLPINQEKEFLVEHLEEWATDQEKWHVIKLHEYIEELEPYAYNAVIMHRDPRAVVLSLMKFRDMSFTTAMSSRMITNYSHNLLIWLDRTPPVFRMVRTYRHIVGEQNRIQLVRNIGEMMRVGINSEDAYAIQNNWSITNNKARALLNLPPNSPEYMSKRHIYTGATDEWRTELSMEQIAVVESRFQEHMRKFDYPFIATDLWLNKEVAGKEK